MIQPGGAHILRACWRREEGQIDLSTVFGMSRVKGPPRPLRETARGLERELKGIGATQEDTNYTKTYMT